MKLEMVPVQIIGIKKDLMPILKQLHRLGCLHIMNVGEIEDLPVRPLTPEPAMLQLQEEYTYLSAQLEGLIATLDHASIAEDGGGMRECSIEEVQTCLADLTPHVMALTERLDTLKAEQSDLPRYAATLQKLLPILPASAIEPDHICVGLLISRAHPQVLDYVKSEISKMTQGLVEFVSGEVDENQLAMLVITHRDYTTEIERLLGHEDISRLRIPTEFDQGPPDKILAAIQRRLSSIPQELKVLEDELRKLHEQWLPPLTQWRNCFKDTLDIYNILPLLGETENTFIILGWVPTRDFSHLEDMLQAMSGFTVVIQQLPMNSEFKKSAPIILSNSALVRPFEGLVKLYSPPSYDGLDPSGLMAFFLPMFFGMMLGDIGYGLILLVLSWFLTRRIRGGFLGDLLRILIMGAAWSIIFGLLYGEFFGTMGEQFGLHPLLFDRASPENLLAFLALTIGVGAAHITIGLFLGVREALYHKSRDHLLERGGMLVGLLALLILILTVLGFLPSGFLIPSIAALLIGMGLLGSPLGLPGLLIGPIEFISLIGNILSYMRIAAIGLASVYLAKVANEVAGALGSLVIGLIFAVLVHTINLAMGAFSPTIHSLRLHYVEFFRKFYEGGGRLYQPFRSRFDVMA